MDRQAGILGRLDDIDSNPFHGGSCPEGIPAGIGTLVVNTAFAKHTASSHKAGGEPQPFLEGCGLDGFDNLEEPEPEGAMEIPVFSVDGGIDPPLGLVQGIDTFCFHLNQEAPFIAGADS